MSDACITLVCKRVIYFSRKDEDAFFAWVNSIACIEKIRAAKNELYLDIISNSLHDHDLRDLLALFYRYNIDMHQLQIFLNNDNKNWFYNKRAYWYERVFGEYHIMKVVLN